MKADNKYSKLLPYGMVVYVLVMCISAVYMYQLPNDMLKSVGVTNISDLRTATQEAIPGFLILGVNFFIGVATIFVAILLLHQKEVIIEYVEYSSVKDANIVVDQKEVDQARLSDMTKNLRLRVLSLQKELVERNEDKLNERIYQALLDTICSDLKAVVGSFSVSIFTESGKRYIEMVAGYACQVPDSNPTRYEFGEGLAGQVAKDGKPAMIANVPDGYINAISGLGKSTPPNLVIYPVVDKGRTVAVFEIASFFPNYNTEVVSYLDMLSPFVSQLINGEELNDKA